MDGSRKEEIRIRTHHAFLWKIRRPAHRRSGPNYQQQAEESTIEFKPRGPRLLQARFNSRYSKLTMIVCYAPIEDATEENKDSFYGQLQAATEEVRTHDMLMIIGDFNARVAENNRDR